MEATTTGYRHILYEVSDRIAGVTMNRPEKRNALSVDHMRELTDCFRAIGADAEVAVVGDLVEQSGPPDFGDAYPLEWPETLAALDRLLSPATVVLPGHGAPVDGAFVRAQHALLTELDWLIRLGHLDNAPAHAVAQKSPFGPDLSLVAVTRGYAELSGRA